MRNYFTFDGVDSRSFGVYISGQGTFKAPARSYDALEIPGRNGALLGIDSRLGNVELTYPAFIYSNFAENIAAFRAFLLSHKGYFKLKDSYHPDEFRLAYYPGPFEPDVTSANNAGSFDITFICKPQRYLESGEEVIELIPGQSETHTYTGNPASFVALGGDQITSLQIPLRFYQDLHGYDRPWPGGGGKNLVDPSKKVTASATTGRWYNDGTGFLLHGSQAYTLSANVSTDATYFVYIYAIGGTQLSYGKWTATYTPSADVYVYFQYYESGGAHLADAELQLELGSTATSFAPYANICPISGLAGLSVYVSPTQDPDDATVYHVDWTTPAGTVYHGTVDVVTGVLTVDRAYKAFDGTEDWGIVNGAYFMTVVGTLNSIVNDSAISTHYLDNPNISTGNYQLGFRCYNRSASPYTGAAVLVRPEAPLTTSLADFKAWLVTQNTNGTPFAVCYELATPITYQLTPTQIAALLAGETFVWSSNNEAVTVEVNFVIPTILENPTLFDALPFLRVYGTGILGIGSHTITITAADVYTDIDCEMMDCFKGSANKNQYVQFSGNDFPTLEPGVNGFSFSGITKVEVKPRWWSV